MFSSILLLSIHDGDKCCYELMLNRVIFLGIKYIIEDNYFLHFVFRWTFFCISFFFFSVFIFIFAVSISLEKNYAINHNEGLVITISNKPSLTPSLCIEASVPSQESERSYRCMLRVSILSFSTIFWLDFGGVPTVWCFFFPLLLSLKSSELALTLSNRIIFPYRITSEIITLNLLS